MSTLHEAAANDAAQQAAKPKIRFLVHTVSSRRDSSGNCYHFARITSTVTGKNLVARVWGESNARGLVYEALRTEKHENVWTAVCTTGAELPIRNWNAAAKNVTLHEGEVTPAMILALEEE